VIGLRALQHEDGRAFLTAARAGRVAQADAKEYAAAVRQQETALGLR
jgi:hypothetical protein